MEDLIGNLNSINDSDFDDEMDDWEQQKLIIENKYNTNTPDIPLKATDLIISTLSVNCKSTPPEYLNVLLDIKLLIEQFEKYPLQQLIYIQKSKNISRKNQVNGCGNRIFYNQYTLNINPYYNPNNTINRITSIKIRLFQNGSIGVCGMKNSDSSDGRLAINILLDYIKNLPVNIYNNITYDENINIINTEPIDKNVLNIYNFKTSFTNSNFNFTTPFYIDRNKLYELLLSQNYLVFKTDKYPAVKLCFYYNNSFENNNGICKCNIKCNGKGEGTKNGECKCITVPIFQSGSVLIFGKFEYHHLIYVYNFITKYLIDNSSIIRQLSSKPHNVKSEKIKLEIKPEELIKILNLKKTIVQNNAYEL
jgi:hypothetical protein